LWRVPSDVRSLIYIYNKRPLKVVNDADMFDLPDEAYDCLLTGTMAHGYRNNGDIDYADKMEAIFEQKIQKLINWSESTKFYEMDFLKTPADQAIFTMPRTITYTVT
jgi:hypothetical protein